MTCPRINVPGTQAGGTLYLDEEVMHRTAFAVAQVSALFAPAPRRGADLLIPGRPGLLSLPRLSDARRVGLPMVIDGQFLPDGTESGHDLSGLKFTLAWLDEHVIAPEGGSSTRLLRLTDPGGLPDQTATVTVEGVTLGQRNRGLWFAVLDLTLPTGRLLFD